MFPAASAGRFRSLLWKTPVEREIESELAFHLEMRIRDYVARGMEPAAAREAALARLGDLDRVRVQCRRIGHLRDRDLRRAEYFAELWLDLRLAFHRHRASPVFAGLAVATLALALAAATVAFAACDALVLRPLLAPDPDRLVRLREIDAQGNDLAVSRLDYLDWRGSQSSGISGGRTLAGLAALLPARRGLSLHNGERVLGVEATASLFPLLGIRAARGALLKAADERRGSPHDVVVLSDRLWHRLGGDPELVGGTLALDGRPYRVRGVLPPGTAFPPGIDLWMPLLLDLGPARQPGRERHDLTVVARLRPPGGAVGRLAAGRELAAVASPRAPGVGPEGSDGGGVRVTPLADWMVGAEPRARSLLALAAALLLGLLASCCVANLLLSRAAGRVRELALRAALGAGRGRILRQLATEGALLAVLAAILALPLANGVLTLLHRRFSALAALAPTLADTGGGARPAASFAAARLAGLALNSRAVGFFLVAAGVAALAVGLAPALAASRVELGTAARSAAPFTPRRSRRLRDALVVTEIAVATLLLVGAGLAIRSYLRLSAADPGFSADRLLTAELALTGERYPPDARRALAAALEARLAQLPGVQAVGSTSFSPWSGERPDPPFAVTWRPSGAPAGRTHTVAADWRSVSPGFFTTLAVPLLAGRWPRGEGDAFEVAIDRSLARRWWPGGGALGERLDLGDPARLATVVGIAGEIADVAPGVPPRPTVFLPYSRRPWRTLTLVVRTAGDPARFLGAVRRAITDVLARAATSAGDGNLAAPEVRPLAQGRAATLAAPRASLLLLALFAVLALVLAAIGVYDLLAAGVSLRTPEIAVRMALGAPTRGVLVLVLWRGLLLAGLGVSAGLLAAGRLARSLPAVLYATSPTDTLSYLATAFLLLAMALAAGLLPALAATRIAPAAVLGGQ